MGREVADLSASGYPARHQALGVQVAAKYGLKRLVVRKTSRDLLEMLRVT